MPSYTRLSLEEREEVSLGLLAGLSLRAMAVRLGPARRIFSERLVGGGPLWLFAFDADPEPHGHTVERHQLESLHEPGQPPRGRLLNQMRVAPVKEHLHGWRGMDGENADARRHPPEIVQHVVQQVRLDMFQDVDTGDEPAGGRRRGPFGNRGIIVMYRQRSLQVLAQGHAKPALAGAVVQELRGADLLYDLGDERRVADGRNPIVGILVQLPLHFPVLLADQGRRLRDRLRHGSWRE